MSAIVQQLMSYGGASAPVGDLVRIAEVVTTGSQTTISFSSIPATYRHLELSVTARVSTVATQVQLQCQFNGDTAGNYDWFIKDRLNGTPGRAASAISFGIFPGASVSADIVGSTTIFIPDYRGTTFQKTMISAVGTKMGTAADTDIVGIQGMAGFWRSTSAISSIVLLMASGNFIDGSTATLYGKL
jgi:hypothetical protein